MVRVLSVAPHLTSTPAVSEGSNPAVPVFGAGPAIDKRQFFEQIRKTLFNNALRQAQVNGIEAILNGWLSSPYRDIRWLAYMLATAYHETAFTMQPIKEYGSNEYLRLNYDVTGRNPTRARQMGNTLPGDGIKYAGRGFVQLTWKNNYRRAGQQLGVDLVGNPNRALELPIATKIMIEGMVNGWFTGRKLADYFNDGRADWTNARRIINGTDRAERLGSIARNFYQALVVATT